MEKEASNMIPASAPAKTMPSSPDQVTLKPLVERAQAGDQVAFTRLFEQFNAPICRYLARLVGNDELGRELAQETFLAVWRGLPGLQDTARFVSWLYRIATNLARSHLRRARLIRWLPWVEHDEGEQQYMYPVLASPEEQVGEAERVALALRQLSHQSWTCLLLQLEGGFSQREIADLLSISEKSVSAYISRGRQHFRQAYQRLASEPDATEKGGRA
jgi:RNA polymerase sigma-70 factor (ECF subfamily)